MSSRGRPSLDSVTRSKEDAKRVFVAEYRFLREANMTHDAIAQRLGLTVATLRTRILRYDCLILSQAEQRIADRLDGLIDAGEPFTLEQLHTLDDGIASMLVQIALKRGRIRSSQSRAQRPRRAPVYTPVGVES
ncbi:hypothetical protein [Nocardia iowensis]|uniref:Uncharacterized protein n=1 Tax=Nocardia iowensis TaxID=204891 RepID=A0ABX8RL64_NOCIO|nr:hypothetical protein [Nocardia iowensis]QXN90313.1 hypothetical protein KV110_33625 [Nocardia iowensis]